MSFQFIVKTNNIIFKALFFCDDNWNTLRIHCKHPMTQEELQSFFSKNLANNWVFNWLQQWKKASNLHPRAPRITAQLSSSWKQQLKNIPVYSDCKNQYKADGVVVLYEIDKLEALLLETSYHFGNDNQHLKYHMTITKVHLALTPC